MKPAVARAAVEAGATMWNDVAALRSPHSLETAAALGCDVVLMHMKGEPSTMQHDPNYDDVVSEVLEFLLARAEAAMAAGTPRSRILIDPGLGFGKRPAHSLALTAHLERFVATRFRVVLGASRKRFIHATDKASPDAADRPRRLTGGGACGGAGGVRGGAGARRARDGAGAEGPGGDGRC